MVYTTEGSVRKGIETRLHKPINDVEWDFIKPFVIYKDAPIHLEDEDLDDYLPSIKYSLKAIWKFEKRNGSEIIASVAKRKNLELNKKEVITNDSVLLSEVMRHKELLNIPQAKNIMHEAELGRNDFNLGEVVSPKNLTGKLIELGAKIKPPGNPLPYPMLIEILSEESKQLLREANESLRKQITQCNVELSALKPENIIKMQAKLYKEIWNKVTSGIIAKVHDAEFYAYCPVYFWDLKYVFIPVNQMGKFRPIFEWIATVSMGTQCHPALALACLICGLPLFPQGFPKLEIVRDRNSIQLFTNSKYTSPKAVSRQFREVRKYGMKETKEIQGIWPRPRHPNQKTIALVSHRNKFANNRWGEIRKEWNNIYPAWGYASNKQMQLAYYKARKRITSY